MEKLTFAICFLLLVTPLVYAFQVDEEIILSDSANEYKVIRQGEEWHRLVLRRGDKTIYEITPVYFLDVPKSDVLWINPIYKELAPRGLYKKVLPFDDITGDSIPNLVIQEYPSPGNHYMPFAVRVLSINQDSVTEFEPIEGGGEVYYFADFNNDGVLEFVNTDGERYFVYNDDGIPLSDNVWILDAKQKKYLKTSSEAYAGKLLEWIKCKIVREFKWANGEIVKCYYSDFSLKLYGNEVFLSWNSEIYPFPSDKEEYIGIRSLLKEDLNGDGQKEYVIAIQLKGLRYVYPNGSTSALPECPYSCVVICSPQGELLKVEFAIITGESNPDFELVDVDGDGLKDVSASGYSTMGIEHLSIVSWQKSNYKYLWGEDDPGLASEQHLFLFNDKTPVIKVGRTAAADKKGRTNRDKLAYKYFVWNGKEFVCSSELSTVIIKK